MAGRVLEKFLIGFLGLFFLSWGLSAQEKINSGYVLHIRQAVDAITVDGVLNEKSWKTADVAKDFHQVLPMDTGRAWAKTEVRMCYDEKNIYLSAVCYDSLKGHYVVESMRRDFSFGKNDNFLVFIDPFDDKTNGFTFGCNAAGAQWDGMMYDGGKVSLSWDNKWESAVKNYDDRYVFEAAIPFKSIRYKKGITKWGINFSRLDLKLNEKSSWAPVTRQFPTASLAFTGILQWEKPPPDPGLNISLIPYGMAGGYQETMDERETYFDWNLGMDAKISVTPSLNLDLTVNPDFSQVEVDDQVTNLSRFELFYPEKRQFFLENSDLFANFGFEDLRPFFSRRIGLNSPIQFGGRLSGKINKNWRIGTMDIQTGKVEEDSIPVQNYAVFALQRQVFARSNISFLFINRQTINFDAYRDDSLFTEYNRNVGLEYNLASANNIWKGKFMFHKTFTPDLSGDDFTHAVNLDYKKRHIQIEWMSQYVGANYNAEVGYVPRRGYWRLSPEISYKFFPKSKKVVSHGPGFGLETYYDGSFRMTDRVLMFKWGVQFLNRSMLGLFAANQYVKLLAPYDPTNSGGDTLATGTGYSWNAVGISYTSTQSSLFTYNIGSYYGGYYNGKLGHIGGGMGFRFQPFGSISVDFSYNNIQLPEPYKSADFWLISPKLDLTFTNKIFFTTYVQYNEQADNINLNARFQWRFMPASDIYLVYTDNYFPVDFNSKNRALVFKITYWYNI